MRKDKIAFWRRAIVPIGIAVMLLASGPELAFANSMSYTYPGGCSLVADVHGAYTGSAPTVTWHVCNESYCRDIPVTASTGGGYSSTYNSGSPPTAVVISVQVQSNGSGGSITSMYEGCGNGP